MGGTISSSYFDPKPLGERRFISKWTRDPERLCPHEGDLIEFYRSHEYSHWGLYLGNGKVVHFNARVEYARSYSDGEIDIFSDDSTNNKVGLQENQFVAGIISVDSLEDLARVPGSVDKINKIRINNKPALRDCPRKPEEIRSLVSKLVNMNGLQYCPNLFNCEHFATYLKFNRSFSESKWNINSNGTLYETKEIKRLYREVFSAQATGKPITVYDAQCYWIVHFMDRVKQQWDENVQAADNRLAPTLLIGELHMEIEDFMSALDKTELNF